MADAGREKHFDLKQGCNQLRFDIGPLDLRKGAYQLSFVIKDQTGLKNLIWTDRRDLLEVEAEFYGDAPYQIATPR